MVLAAACGSSSASIGGHIRLPSAGAFTRGKRALFVCASYLILLYFAIN
jgi:hypothetical protein